MHIKGGSKLFNMKRVCNLFVEWLFKKTKYYEMAMRDQLTGLYNRHGFMELMPDQLFKAKNEKKYLSVLFIDLNNFKQMNDTFGHAAGDEVLKTVSDVVCDVLSGQKYIACRYGGDEFVVLLTYHSQLGTQMLAEKLQKCIAKTAIYYKNNMLTASISIGVSYLKTDAQSIFDLIDEADKAMLRDKKKNCAHLFN